MTGLAPNARVGDVIRDRFAYPGAALSGSPG
jgi:hypothetical protein